MAVAKSFHTQPFPNVQYQQSLLCFESYNYIVCRPAEGSNGEQTFKQQVNTNCIPQGVFNPWQEATSLPYN